MRPLLIISIFILTAPDRWEGRAINSTMVAGDLYFSFAGPPNFYGLPDSVIKKAEAMLDTIHLQYLNADDSAIFAGYKLLQANGLLYQPYILLKLDNDSSITILLERPEYQKIAPTNFDQLIRDSVKLRVKALVEPFYGSLYYGNGILSIDTIKGKTMQHYLKFRLNDYK